VNILDELAGILEIDQNAQLFRAVVASLDAENVYRDAVLADSPVGYWRMGEAAGPTLVDLIAAHNGTYIGGPTFLSGGALLGSSNAAVTYNGSTQYAELAYAAALNPAQWTIEIWCYPTAGAGSQRQAYVSFHFTGADPKGFYLEAGSGNTWNAVVGDGALFQVITGPAVVLNVWTHLALSFDGTNATFYVNGANVGSLAVAYVANPDTVTRFGAGTPAAAFYWPGRLDEAALYATALPLARITAHYNAARAASTGNLIRIIRAGQPNPDDQLYPKLDSVTVIAGNEVIVARIGSGYVVLGKVVR
jgi:hypothetical protein